MATLPLHTRLATASSVVLRTLSYIFLRVVLYPPLPAVIFALLAINLPSSIWAYLYDPQYQVVEEKVTLVAEIPVGDKNGGPPDEDSAAVIEQTEYLGLQSTPVAAPGKVILLGTPSPHRPALTWLSILVNILCAGMVADRLFRERYHTGEDLSFVRVGYVSDTEAKLLIREPDQSKMPVTIELHIKHAQPPFDNTLWQTAGGVRWTTNETDYTAVVTVPLRHAKQRTYEWRSSNNHSGEFTAAPRLGQVSESGEFTFLSTSCVVNRLPYNPFDHPLSIVGMRRLAKVLPSLGAQFMLFLGDFIYADVPRWWGTEVSEYRQKYRQVYASPEWQTVGQNLSWIHVLDDHEIQNDWSSNTTGVYSNAVEPWHHYHTAANPPRAKRAGTSTLRSDATWFQFSQGPASFFLLDTRSYRSSNFLPSKAADKTMLGSDQLEDLVAFLNKPEPRGIKWKFIASSVPFTKNWPINTKDTWGGFLHERSQVLEAMWDAGARGYGVVVLSGDRHEFAATKFPPPAESKWPESATVYEFSASPLSQFFGPVPTYRQTDKEDVMIKYINWGSSKFGAITIGNIAEDDHSSLLYRLFVDGVNTWNWTITSPPAVVEEKVAGSFWDRLGFN
ncbi:hypothetical protein GQ53DRAFT_843238 [Thozetella sp. PMI_491]|nr:hypothetical protein GQ53DRAFT_843238 [Thozetella sp. PMI_491]